MYHRIFQPKTHAFFSLHTLIRARSRNPKQFSRSSLFHSSRNTLASGSNLDFALKEFEQLQSLRLIEEAEEESQSQSRSPPSMSSSDGSKIEISHPWPEWVELMERLLKNGYFAGSGVISGLGSKDSNRIRTACLNFARDRSDLVSRSSWGQLKHCLCFGNGVPVQERKILWRQSLFSLLQSLWRERNNKIFDNKLESAKVIFHKVRGLVIVMASGVSRQEL